MYVVDHTYAIFNTSTFLEVTLDTYWLATSKVTALGSSRFVFVTLTTLLPSIPILTMTSFPVSE